MFLMIYVWRDVKVNLNYTRYLDNRAIHKEETLYIALYGT